MGLGPVHVELRGVSKRFGATRAADAVDLSIARGTVHALVGENGAGKSTVARIISGVIPPDSGMVLVDGEPVDFRSPRQAFEAGITMMAQELSLVPERSVGENVFLGIEPAVGGFVARRRLRQRFDELLERSGVEVPFGVAVGALTVGEQQKVEILRAVVRRARLIIMDEPSARLSHAERRSLYDLIASLRRDGTTILFISHLLDEVLDIADLIGVMRDGAVVRTSPAGVETAASLVKAMIGRELGGGFPPKRVPPRRHVKPVLSVRGLCSHDGPAVDLDVHAGEIVGIAGLVGSGRTELVRLIYGADRPGAGTVVVGGAPLRHRRPAASIRAGLGFIPESRKDQGLLLGRKLRENVSLPHLERLSTVGFLQRSAERGLVARSLAAAGVRGGGSETPVRLLSGGNQQKSLFARWLLPTLRVLIADEPTRGVDVGSKRAIYDLLVEATSGGLGVLVVSSELDELVGLCHRVLVMRHSRIVAELRHPHLDEDTVLAHAFGEAPPAAGPVG